MELIIATSLRSDGPMGFSYSSRSDGAKRRRAKFLKKLGIPASRVVIAGLIHGTRLQEIQKIPQNPVIPRADALVSAAPDIFLAATTADCFPVFFYSKPHRIAGIIHAGWRGLVQGIMKKTLRAVTKRYRLGPENFPFVIGPGIRACHFEIKNDVLPAFRRHRGFIQNRRGRLYVDLVGIIRDELRLSGIPLKNIRGGGVCTYQEGEKYFSYRRDKSVDHPRGYGNMISVIGFKS